MSAGAIAMPLGAHARALLNMFFWGQTVPLHAVLLQTFDPLGLTLARYLLGVPVILAMAQAWRCLRPLPRGRDLVRLALLGVFGMSGLAVLSTLGLALSDAVTAVFIGASAPLIHTALAVMRYDERLVPGSILAFVLAIPGIVLVSADRVLEVGMSFRGGEVLLVIGSFCWSWYSLQARRWFPGMANLRLTCWSMSLSLPFLALVFWIAAQADLAHLPLLSADWPTLAILAWLVLTSTCLGVILWHGTVYRLGMTIAAVYLTLVPIFGLALGLAFGFVPSLLQVIGGLMILIGVVQLALRRMTTRAR